MNGKTAAMIGGAFLAGAVTLGTVGVASGQAGMAGGWGSGGMMAGVGSAIGRGSMGSTWHAAMTGSHHPGGMMNGYGAGGMMGGAWLGAATPPRSLADARGAFQGYLDGTGNADLALDEVMEFDANFYATVKERGAGTAAFELVADKTTGAVFPEPGPNMMWNTKYGHLAGGMMGGSQAGGQPTVTPERARELAQVWLDANQPGSATEAPDAFPGYYTVHTLKAGTISGMLSVNAATSQVWYHTWHGGFVASSEAGH
jgi:hypothetical protein